MLQYFLMTLLTDAASAYNNNLDTSALTNEDFVGNEQLNIICLSNFDQRLSSGNCICCGKISNDLYQTFDCNKNHKFDKSCIFNMIEQSGNENCQICKAENLGNSQNNYYENANNFTVERFDVIPYILNRKKQLNRKINEMTFSLNKYFFNLTGNNKLFNTLDKQLLKMILSFGNYTQKITNLEEYYTTLKEFVSHLNLSHYSDRHVLKWIYLIQYDQYLNKKQQDEFLEYFFMNYTFNAKGDLYLNAKMKIVKILILNDLSIDYENLFKEFNFTINPKNVYEIMVLMSMLKNSDLSIEKKNVITEWLTSKVLITRKLPLKKIIYSWSNPAIISKFERSFYVETFTLMIKNLTATYKTISIMEIVDILMDLTLEIENEEVQNAFIRFNNSSQNYFEIRRMFNEYILLCSNRSTQKNQGFNLFQ